MHPGDGNYTVVDWLLLVVLGGLMAWIAFTGEIP